MPRKKPPPQPESEDIMMILERIDKLSRRPENPSLAYHNLDLIHTLADRLKQKFARGGEA